MIRIDLIGVTFGRLTVQSLSHVTDKGVVYWKAKCSCGQIRIIKSAHLRYGDTRSCGCLARDEAVIRCKTHGQSKTKLYRVWNSMKKRCYKETNNGYRYYGARGVIMCDRWLKFSNFFEDMGGSYAVGLSIERRDTNGNYEKSNCYWATNDIQQNNRRSNVFITYNGTTKTIANWSKEVGIGYVTFWLRVKNWGIEKALATPLKNNKFS